MHVSGVSGLRNELEIHRTPNGVPSLQGQGTRLRRRSSWRRENWPPTTRVLGGAAGAWLAGWGLREAGLARNLLGLGGLLLLTRAATNTNLRRLTGIGAGRRAVDVQKSIYIDAPVEEAFAVWSDLTNLPRFMSTVREVKPVGDDRLHWEVEGPAGMSFQWTTETTRLILNRLIAWRTVPGSAVEHAGTVRFEPANGGAMMHVRMSYNPPGGAIGHLFAAIFGANPIQAMEQDLLRFKSLLETGRTTVEGREVREEELRSPTPGFET
jgi:uncharacterized membrane protein